jgi:hypothetical protein
MRRLVALLLGSALAVAGCSSGTSTAGYGATTTTSNGTTNGTGVATGEPAGTVTYTGLSRNHVDTPVNYPQNPPVGGPHSPIWQNCGFYDKEFPKERGVHSMEHGAVWVTYSPSLAAADVAVLKAFADNGRKVLVSPYTGLPTPVVASAWGKQLQLQSVNDPRLAQFVHYFDNGPQTPEQGVPCSQGTSATT